MTCMLASVTGPEEAEIALAGGADIIDLKDPSRGAVTAATVRETVRVVGGRRAVSAAVGLVPTPPHDLAVAVRAMAQAGANSVEVGILGDDDPARCIGALAPLAARIRLVGILFADAAPDLSVLERLAEAGFAGAMLDTGDKGGGRLLTHMDLPQLRRFVRRCRACGLTAGLAGSLEQPDIPRLLVIAPDVLGFRRALRGTGERGATLDLGRVRAVRALIPEHAREAGVSGVDLAPTAPSRPSPAAGIDPARTDVVFVHDFVLPARIGAYAHERHASQRVRFDVDATILRLDGIAENMRDIFSYDLITDGIRLLVDGGRIDLVETLAERIAAMLLAHPRVVKARVRVQKLDTGSGSVGIAIERTADAPGLDGTVTAK